MPIDTGKYLKLIDCFFKYNHMCKPFEIEKIIKFKKNKQGYIIAWQIDKAKITLSQLELELGKLTASECFLFDKEKNQMKPLTFSFDFRKISDNYKDFRIDDDDNYPVHAHDYNYDTTKKHLSFPEDIQLEINNIDFYTMLSLLQIYLLKPDCYPLEVHIPYNKMMSLERSKYYEK